MVELCTLDVEVRLQVSRNNAMRYLLKKNNVTENSGNDEFLCSCCHLTSSVSISNSNCRLHAAALNNKD